jgi:hypothetical protein
MLLLAIVDYRIWFAVGILLLWGLLAVLQYRTRRDLRRNIQQLHVTIGSLKQRIEEDRESINLYRRSASSETTSVAGFNRAEVEHLKQEIEAFRHSVEADINQLGEVMVGLEARLLQSGLVEQPSNAPGKTALFTLRADVDKLRAEVSALQASRRIRTPPQQVGDRRPRLPKMEQVLATLDERRGDEPPVASEGQETVN